MATIQQGWEENLEYRDKKPVGVRRSYQKVQTLLGNKGRSTRAKCRYSTFTGAAASFRAVPNVDNDNCVLNHAIQGPSGQ